MYRKERPGRKPQAAFCQAFAALGLGASRRDVYMTRGGVEQMVWSGTSEMTEPSTMEDVRNSVVAQVVSRLSEQGIILRSGNTKGGE